MRSEIIKPVKKVRGGVSVSHEKHTKDMQVKRIPAPETVTLPMSQHIGAPCTPTVKVGDRVLVGQVVGDTDKYVSAPVHASVSGKVTAGKGNQNRSRYCVSSRHYRKRRAYGGGGVYTANGRNSR